MPYLLPAEGPRPFRPLQRRVGRLGLTLGPSRGRRHMHHLPRPDRRYGIPQPGHEWK